MRVQGATSVFGFSTALIPQILIAVAQLTDNDVFVVVEDSAWPTIQCTPGNLLKLYHDLGMPIWCGAYKSPTGIMYASQIQNDGRVIKRAQTMSPNPTNDVRRKQTVLAPSAACCVDFSFLRDYGLDYGTHGLVKPFESG